MTTRLESVAPSNTSSPVRRRAYHLMTPYFRGFTETRNRQWIFPLAITAGSRTGRTQLFTTEQKGASPIWSIEYFGRSAKWTVQNDSRPWFVAKKPGMKGCHLRLNPLLWQPGVHTSERGALVPRFWCLNALPAPRYLRYRTATASDRERTGRYLYERDPC